MRVLLFTVWRIIAIQLTDIILFHLCKTDGDKKSQELHICICIQNVWQNIPPEMSWILDIYSVVTLRNSLTFFLL